jgi:adenylate cyclase
VEWHGARRTIDGRVVLNLSEPAVDDGRPFEVEVTTDGRRLPLPPLTVASYDPRGGAWYQQAAANGDQVWTEPFRFAEGRPGVTSALALRWPESGALRGVFTVDFYLDQITAYLAELSRQSRSQVQSPFYAVLTRRSNPVASVSGAGPEQASSVLAAALAATPRDLADLPLDEPEAFTFDSDSVTYAAQLRAFPVSHDLEWIVLAAVPRDEFLEVVYANRRLGLGLGLILLLIAIGIGGWIAGRIARPLGLIADDLRRVGQLELTPTPTPTSFVRETLVVSDAVDRMKASLRSFGHYVPIHLVHELLQTGQEARLGGEARRLTIFFSDVVGFTSISEQMAPADLVAHLGEYLEAMAAILEAHDGAVDKFVGDGIMALFNAPRPLPEHAGAACRAALHSQARLRELRAGWREHGRPPLRARIGLHTGDAIVGNIGTPDRFDFTVMGDAVNLASRLEGLNKLYGTEILASEEVRLAAGPGLEWRTIDRVAVVGRAGGTTICELLGEIGAVPRAVLDARVAYEAGLASYLDCRFDDAAKAFARSLDRRPADVAAGLLLARARELLADPPGTWDGVFRARTK